MADYKLISTGYIYRNSDGASIPPDETNSDYRQYLDWLAEDPLHVADPADDIPADLTEGAWNQIRATRNQLLTACDWTILPDSPLTTEQKAAWLTYRQDLRDIPQDYATIESIVWPTEPA